MKYYKITLTDLDGFDHTEIVKAKTLCKAIDKAYDDADKFTQEWCGKSGQLLTKEETEEYLAEQESLRIEYLNEREFV